RSLLPLLGGQQLFDLAHHADGRNLAQLADPIGPHRPRLCRHSGGTGLSVEHESRARARRFLCRDRALSSSPAGFQTAARNLTTRTSISRIPPAAVARRRAVLAVLLDMSSGPAA